MNKLEVHVMLRFVRLCSDWHKINFCTPDGKLSARNANKWRGPEVKSFRFHASKPSAFNRVLAEVAKIKDKYWKLTVLRKVKYQRHSCFSIIHQVLAANLIIFFLKKKVHTSGEKKIEKLVVLLFFIYLGVKLDENWVCWLLTLKLCLKFNLLRLLEKKDKKSLFLYNSLECHLSSWYNIVVTCIFQYSSVILCC